MTQNRSAETITGGKDGNTTNIDENGLISFAGRGIVLNPLKSMQTFHCGFDRENTSTLGIMQYCHDASSGIVDNIDENGTYTVLTGQTHFADGTTLLADRTLAAYHSSGETQFSYWVKGNLHEVTGIKTIQLAVDFSGYIIFDDTGELVVATDFNDAIVLQALFAYVINNDEKARNIWLGDERHGVVMDGQTHKQQHFQYGFGWARSDGALEISGLANNATTFTSISSGKCGDEDIPMVFPTTTAIPTAYRDGVNGQWTITTATDNNLGYFDAGKCVYNEDTGAGWQLSEINSDYVIMTLMLTNNKKAPIVRVIGQTLYSDRGEARDHLPGAVGRLESGDFPGEEMLALCSYIIHNESSGQIEVGANGEVYIDTKRKYPVPMF